MSQPTVCLSFDWDGVSVWMAGGATDARSLSRGEFGPRVGVPRLLELCKRLGITATFFTPGHTAETFPETAGVDRRRRTRDRGTWLRPRGLRAALCRRGARRDPPSGRRDRARGGRATARDAVPAVGGRRRAFRDAARGGLHLLVVRDGRCAPALGTRGGCRPPRRPQRGRARDRTRRGSHHVHHQRLRVLRVQRLRQADAARGVAEPARCRADLARRVHVQR